MSGTKTKARAQPALETPERAQHAAAIIDRNIGTAIGAPRGRLIQTPLDRLFVRNSITQRQFSAGAKLKEDFEVGMLGAKDAEGNFALGIRGQANHAWVPDVQLDAIRRFKQAMIAVGAHVGAVLVAFCCYDRDVVKIAVQQGRNRDKVMGIVEAGLDTLADHYGLLGNDKHRAMRGFRED
jgi:hypothetical protein